MGAKILLKTALVWAEKVLDEAGIVCAKVDAQLLAAHFLQVSLGDLRSMVLFEKFIDSGYEELVLLRAKRVPLQHITGKAYFRNVVLEVGEGVFIPRPETEILVDLVSANLCLGQGVVVDLGCGSGAIAASVAEENLGAQVYAVEVSLEAYRWALRNLGGKENVVLCLGDLVDCFFDLNGLVDVVVSNPPYIPPNCVPRDVEVALYDPPLALYGGGADGLQVPRLVLQTAQRLLKSGGFCVIEHAEVQAGGVVELFSSFLNVWYDVVTHYDLTGRKRATSARLR